MIPLLDAVGTAVWRASWQAAALALLVFVLARCCGERLAPRWRYLLWSLVVARLLLVATPSSPWSLFNFVGWNTEPEARQVATRESRQQNTRDASFVSSISDTSVTRQATESAQNFATEAEPKAIAVHSGDPTNSPSIAVAAAARPAPVVGIRSFGSYVVRILPGLWLAGCFLFGVKLLASACVLRRRVAACRPVTDAAVLNLLESTRAQFGLKRAPALLVTPEAISPCLVGTWNPKIVLPEAIVIESPPQALAHVLSHELAHLVRGDLWTNWLLLAARILHWFNPVAWWTIREMQAEREAACDELALAALGQTNRQAYAATVVDLAARLVPSAIAPGMIGLFSSAGRLHSRVGRLLRFPTVKTLRSPFAAGMLLAIATAGLTDAMPGALPAVTAEQPKAKARPAAVAPAKVAPVAAQRHDPWAPRRTLRGQCIDHVDKSPLAGITVRIFKAQGRTSPIVEQAKTITDRDGNFEFADLIPPRPDDPVDQLIYLIFAEMDNRPIGMGGTWTLREGDPNHCNFRIFRDQTKLTGTVLNPRGQPVKGATVAGLWDIDGRPVPGILSATTDAAGRFQIDRIPDFKKAGRPSEMTFTISHPDYPKTKLRVAELPSDVTVSLQEGCRVTGTITDNVTGKPAVGAVVLSQNADDHSEVPAVTNAAGRFELALAEGRYTFLANAPDRVCVALTDRECLAGEKVELPPFQLIAGGFISGRVLISATDEPRTLTAQGEPIGIGLYGPSHPKGKVISPRVLAKVDETGRFTVRAAPGDNFPYFVNFHGDRMAWDTTKQRPVVVKEGETTAYDMLITPKIPASEKLKIARQFVESLPIDARERTAKILDEFRKLDEAVDFEIELWCTLTRELVAIGPDAVPSLCAELDQTTQRRMLLRLAFALRAIGDPRAVPALIRAIPKTLLPSSSDFGLIVEDKDLTAFMQKHDLDEGEGGTYFGLGRPEREVQGALLKLTRRNPNDVIPFGLSRSEDPRRQVLQRRILQRRAQEWQTWWDAHGRELTSDPAYQKVNLEIVDEPLPPAATKLGPNARLGNEGWTGAVLSPAVENGRYAWFFYDLDSGDQPRWPAHFPKDEAKIDQQKLADWAVESGVDLMCVTHRAPDGKQTYVLRTFGVKAWEIGPRDLRNIDKLIAAGKLPEGRDIGELLMHYDAESERLVPDANGAFIFVTREGSMGLIEVTDRVVRTQNLNGLGGQPPGGVGFNLGVRFNLRMIIP